jgi:hypothetical protein
MKKMIILTALFLTMPVMADQYVNGYYRSNGTYVQGYNRSSSNYTQYDNYSTKGNYNPYTGQAGTVNVNTPQHNYGYNYGHSYSNSNNNSYRTNGYQY